MNGTTQNIPPELEFIYKFLSLRGREGDIEFLKRCIHNKSRGFGIRDYELARLNQFEVEAQQSLENSNIVEEVVPVAPTEGE